MEPASPEALIPRIGLWPWAVGAAVLLLVAILLTWWLRRRRRRTYDPMSVRIAAHQEALAGLNEINAEDAREAAIRCSLVLRRYLSLAANDPALFETHEEFVSRRDALKVLQPEARAAAAVGFEKLASLKYGPDSPMDAPATVIGDGRLLLETLHGGFAA